jgi:hypothetical protein
MLVTQIILSPVIVNQVSLNSILQQESKEQIGNADDNTCQEALSSR